MTTQTIPDPDQLLMGGSSRSAKFEKHGDMVTGEVVSRSTRQQTDFKTGKPLTWDDGNPRWQVVITVATGEADDDDDDGMRSIFVKIPSQLARALADACRTAQVKGIAKGGQLSVTYVSDAKPAGKGMSGAKQYEVMYDPPAVGADDEGPF